MKTDDLLLLGLAYLLTRRKGAAAPAATPTTTPPPAAPPPSEPPALPPVPDMIAPAPAARPPGRARERVPAPRARTPASPPRAPARAPPAAAQRPAPTPATRMAALVARANQPGARAWIPYLVRQGAPESLAAGLARWIGIESSGKHPIVSRAGERGLLQILPSTAKLALSPADWATLADARADKETIARITLKQFRWHLRRAGLDDKRPITDQLWYAKAHHTRPADLRATTLRPDATTAARVATTRATTEAQKHRLAVANVVAFGDVVPVA